MERVARSPALFAERPVVTASPERLASANRTGMAVPRVPIGAFAIGCDPGRARLSPAGSEGRDCPFFMHLPFLGAFGYPHRLPVVRCPA